MILPTSVHEYVKEKFPITGSLVVEMLTRYRYGDDIHRTETFMAILKLSNGSTVKINQMVSLLMSGKRRYVMQQGSPKEISLE
jgi:hypothetical protein